MRPLFIRRIERFFNLILRYYFVYTVIFHLSGEKGLNVFKEFGNSKRLTYEENAALAYLFYRRIARAHQNGLDMFEAFNGAEPVMQFEAIHIGQAIIKNEEVRGEFIDSVERITRIDMVNSKMIRLLVNNLHKQIPDILVIFDYENQFCGIVIG